MAGPDALPYGDSVQYPTLVFGNTRLYIHNPDRHYSGKISVWVPGHTEDVLVNSGQTNHIERDWRGTNIFVSNIGGPTLTVWTA